MVRVKAVARLKVRAVTSAVLADTGSDVAFTGVSVSAEAVPVCGNLIATLAKPALVDVSNPAPLIGETLFEVVTGRLCPTTICMVGTGVLRLLLQPAM